MVNLFGKGFIGGTYASMYPSIVNDRNDLTPKSNDILYFISTTDNYNVHTNPYLDIETNLTTLIRVLENCRKLENVTFNYISSWYVYGSVDMPVTEYSLCNPEGFYSITKRTAEQLIITYCNIFNIKYKILRLSNVIGIGDKNVSAKKNVLTHLLRKIQNNEEIILHNDGNFYRDYIHVNDVCNAINLVINVGENNQIYNIGSGKSVKFRDIIDYIITTTHSRSTIKSITIDQPLLSFYMNIDKVKNLGFISKYDIYTMINELICDNIATLK